MERQRHLLGLAACERRVGLLPRGRRRAARPRRRHGADHAGRRRAARRRLRAGEALPRDHRRRARARPGRAPEHVVRTRVYVTDAARLRARSARAHGEVFGDDPAGDARASSSRAARPALARRDRGGGARRREADLSRRRSPARAAASPRAAACSTTRSARATRTRSASRRSTCCSTARRSTSSSTSTPCSPRSRATSSSRGSTPELMQSVLEVATPVCHTPADVAEQLPHAARLRLRTSRASEGMRVGSAGTHPFSLFERAAHHREGPLPRARRPDAVHRAARADLRHARARRRRRPGEGDPGRERAHRPSRGARRALGELAVLARRADRPRVVAAHGLRGVPALGPAAALPQTTPTTPRSSASSSAPAASPTTRTSGGTSASTRGSARSRSGSATRVTQLEDVIALTAFCQALVKHYAERFDAGEEIPSYHRILTTENKWLAARYGLEAPVMDLATGRRNRVPVAQLDPPHAEAGRAARARARLGGGARGHRGDPPPRQRRRPPAARLQREPRHRRGRARDRRADRGRSAERAPRDRRSATGSRTRASGRRRRRARPLAEIVARRADPAPLLSLRLVEVGG